MKITMVLGPVWALALILAAAFVGGAVVSSTALGVELIKPKLDDFDVHELKLGGDFTLTNQFGKPTSLKQFAGRVVVLFFGYTYCPDVCPMTLSKLGTVQRGMGKRGAKLQLIFVSIDPERDTPLRLKAYLQNFAKGTVGLTGTPAQVDAAARLYRAKFERQDPTATSGYLMAHSSILYVLDRKGQLRYMFPTDVEDDLLAQAVTQLLGR